MNSTNQGKPNSSWLKTFSIGFSIISFGITLAIIGYIVLTTKQNQPTNQQPISISPTDTQPSTTSTLDETANWKTFTSSEGKFSFKYPGNLLGPCDSGPHDKVTSFYESSLDCNLKPNSSSLLEVFVYDPEKFVIETIELGKPVSSKKIPLSGREFTIDEYIPSYKKMGEKVIIAKTRLSEKTVIELNFSLNQVLKKATVDQILSTFRFIP